MAPALFGCTPLTSLSKHKHRLCFLLWKLCMLSQLIAQTLAEVFILSENRKITFSFILILEALSITKLNHIISQQCFVRWHDKKVYFSRRANNTDPGQTNLKQFCYCAQTCSVEEAPGKDLKFHRWANNFVLIYKNQENFKLFISSTPQMCPNGKWFPVKEKRRVVHVGVLMCTVWCDTPPHPLTVFSSFSKASRASS